MFLWMAIGLSLLTGYFLPTIVAVMRRHGDLLAVAVVNVFLGWTVIGWVVALAWSVKRQAARV